LTSTAVSVVLPSAASLSLPARPARTVSKCLLARVSGSFCATGGVVHRGDVDRDVATLLSAVPSLAL
jgi:hypothetical protein